MNEMRVKLSFTLSKSWKQKPLPSFGSEMIDSEY